MSHNIYDALEQVRQLKTAIIDTRKFYGYSGPARLIGALLTMLTLVIMTTTSIDSQGLTYTGNLWQHPYLICWGILGGIGMLINYAAVLRWLIKNVAFRSHPKLILPLVESTFPNIIGIVLSIAAVKLDAINLVYPIWLITIGQMNFNSRRFTSKYIGWLGLYYITWGMALAFIPENFYQITLFGTILTCGELTGGILLLPSNLKKS